MGRIYGGDLAYIHATAFETLARGAAAEILRRLRNADIPIRHVIDVGCGAGPLTQALVDVGFEVTGVEPSAELLQAARAAVPSARFVNSSVYEIPMCKCDAVVALGEPLTYHENPDEADRLVLSFFRSVADQLPRGGQFIFDVIETGGPTLSGRSWMSGEDWAVLVDTTEVERTLVRNIETFRLVDQHYRRGYETHKVRLFETEVLCAELVACGFNVETSDRYGAQRLPPRRRAFFASRV
jgi:SAM-dependent methyltransferase